VAVQDLVVVGAGGHGREVFDTLLAVNADRPTFNVLGVVDDAPQHTDRLERIGLELLGDVDWLVEHPCTYVLGIGTSGPRRALSDRLGAAGMTAATVVHPGAHIGPDCRLGEGVMVFDRSTVTTNVTLGRHTHLNIGCSVQHDTVVGEFVQFSPGVLVNGDCVLGDDVFLGTSASVTRGHTVGDGAKIGAGAVVLHDVDPGTLVVGAPARPV
jgi:sugar O-acyltransferase (sialic acid O-acetyltransferase NeuD family)